MSESSSPSTSVFSGMTTVTFSSSASSSPSPSSSRAPQSSQPSSSPSFYRNLFYILIGLLVAFALVSFLSLLRARRRRSAIVREARRLGLMVPGIPGYVSMRERQNMKWTKADGTQNPDWWEIDSKRDTDVPEKTEYAGQAQEGEDDFVIRPLAIIPRSHVDTPAEEPMPQSDLPFFPNHLAYRPAVFAPQPARFNIVNDEVLHQLRGEDVDIVTVIRMPVRESQREPEEGEEVIREWGGVEFGIARMEVTHRD